MSKILTMEILIERFEKFHGKLYDYSKAKFTKVTNKIEIICPIHGSFWQTPEYHAKNKCGKCAKKEQWTTTEEFIEKSRKVHGDRYDYSKSIYLPSPNKIEVICKEHGPFLISSSNHYLGKGCPKCVGRNLTTEEYVEKCKSKLGEDAYDYSLIELRGCKDVIKVRCKKHNHVFEVLPWNFLDGRVCEICNKERLSDIFLKSTEQFISECRNIFGDLYDYSKVVYKGIYEKVEVICKTHGSWWVLPGNHRQPNGCPKCAGKNRTTEEYIALCNKIHDNSYDYTKTVFVNNRSRIIVTCPKHGDWTPTAEKHLQCGCPVCNMSRGELNTRICLKSLNLSFEPQYKFKDCRNIYPLRFDFAVLNEDKTVKFLIEYQGSQHFEPFSFGSSNKDIALKNFEDLQKRDKIKSDYCKNNGIPLLFIHYSNINHIPEIVKSFIRSLDDLLEPL